MKIRNGFVSNSSSSSFIVAFPRKPKNARDVQTILFGDVKEIHDPWDDAIKISTTSIATRVWNDMKGQTPNKYIEILAAVEGGWMPDTPDMEDFKKIPMDDEPTEVLYGGIAVLTTIVIPEYDWEGLGVARDAVAKAATDRFMGGLSKTAMVYTFNYGDDNGDGDLENGGIFDRLPHKQISRH